MQTKAPYRPSFKVQIDILNEFRMPVIISDVVRAANISPNYAREKITLLGSFGLVKILDGEEKRKAERNSVKDRKGFTMFSCTEKGERALKIYAEIEQFFRPQNPPPSFYSTLDTELVYKILRKATDYANVSSLGKLGEGYPRTVGFLPTLESCGMIKKLSKEELRLLRDVSQNSDAVYKTMPKGTEFVEKYQELKSLFVPEMQFSLGPLIRETKAKKNP
ncbi:MAG: hypothetical protein KGH71_01835 [Candidatus Micrarchaeota archaeon]|nr:hypothetical protein [Candidatus Micrarchaeota archaeon]